MSASAQTERERLPSAFQHLQASHILSRQAANHRAASESSGVTKATPVHNQVYKQQHTQLVLGISCHVCARVSMHTINTPFIICVNQSEGIGQQRTRSLPGNPLSVQNPYPVLKECAQTEGCGAGTDEEELFVMRGFLGWSYQSLFPSFISLSFTFVCLFFLHEFLMGVSTLTNIVKKDKNKYPLYITCTQLCIIFCRLKVEISDTA